MTNDKTILKWNYNQDLFAKTEWYRYYGEYSSAIKNLIEQSNSSQTTVLTLPTLFLIRHSLELAYKLNLIELEKISGEKVLIVFSGKKAHILSVLHKEFERQVKIIIGNELISKSIQKDFNARNDELKRFRNLFDKLDNWSYSFRYPIKSDGKSKSFNKDDKINMAEIIPVYKTTEVFLKYTIDVLLDPASKRV